MRAAICRALFLLGDTLADVPNVVLHLAMALDSRALFWVGFGLSKVARSPGRLAWWLFPATCERL